MENEHNKFGIVETVFGLLVFFPLDLVCILIDLTGVGLAIAPCIQGLATFVMRWWFKSHGDQNALAFNGKQVARYLSNLLPLLPTLTTIFLLDVYTHNNPGSGIAKLEQKVGKAASVGTKPAAITSTKDIRATARALGAPEPIE